MSGEPDALAHAKALMRRQVREAMLALAPGERQTLSARACEALIATDLFARARAVLLYAPADDEPNISLLAGAAADAGVTIAVPGIDWASKALIPRIVRDLGPSLVPGKHGVRVPPEDAPLMPVGSIDLIVIPGVAFDRSGGRLGRGGGFYDRFLGGQPRRAPVVAVALPVQVVGSVPRGGHDARIDALALPTGVLLCGNPAGLPDGTG